MCWGTAAMCAGVPEPGPLYCPIDDTSTTIHSQILANYQQIPVGPSKSLATPGKLLGSFQIFPDFSDHSRFFPDSLPGLFQIVPDFALANPSEAQANPSRLPVNPSKSQQTGGYSICLFFRLCMDSASRCSPNLPYIPDPTRCFLMLSDAF